MERAEPSRTAWNSEKETARGYEAVEALYHAFLTGLILTAATRRGASGAAELVFQIFRRQHLEKFLPGLEKLGLDDLPHAVACAQYHYLSNALGGVKVEYIYETDRKAWVRYPPPRWIFEGTAICGIPTEVSRAMLRGWHAHNGVTLGNPRLGFVCTGQTVDGQPGLEGYYLEDDRELAPEERLRFSPGEEAPPFDPTAAPRAEGADWPEERLRKVLRNYAMEYVRTMLPTVIGLFGPAEGSWLAGSAARLIGMQYYDQTAELLGISGDSTEDFAEYLVRFGTAQGDRVEWGKEADHVWVRQQSWRLMRGVADTSPGLFDIWNELWVGALGVHNRFLRLSVNRRLDCGDECYEWRIRERGESR
jgi:hypothetical protein